MKRGSSLRRTLWPMPRMWVASGMRRLLRARGGLAAQLRGPVLDSFDDVHVARTPAQIAGDAAAYLLLRRTRIGRQQRLGGHQHAWRAEAALQTMLLPEALL